MTKENQISIPENLIPFRTSTSKYKLNLLALPEYQDKDISASTQLADGFSQITTIYNGLSCRLQVSDGYIDENEAHYQLDVTWGNDDTNLSKDFDLVVPYSATADGENFNGLIKVGVSLPINNALYTPEFLTLHRCDLSSWALKKYQELMEQIYPEWQTTYQKISYQFSDSLQS